MRHSRICLGATAPPSLLVWELPRGQWGHSQTLISGGLRQQLGCAGRELVKETKLGLGSAWLLHFLMCVGDGEKMVPPMLLPSGHRAAHPEAREEQDGMAAPLQISGSSGSAPACCHSSCALPQAHPRHHCRGKKGIECEAQEAKDVNAPLEAGDASLPRRHQGWDRVSSVWPRAWRGTEVVVRPKEGRSSPALSFWECRGRGVKGKCCR